VVVKQTQIDLATLAQQLLAADQNNNTQELTALVKSFAEAVRLDPWLFEVDNAL
jgi:hypothetical protein